MERLLNINFNLIVASLIIKKISYHGPLIIISNEISFQKLYLILDFSIQQKNF